MLIWGRSQRSMLTATTKYAAGALIGLALHQAQIHQTRPLGFPYEDNDEDGSGRGPSEERGSSCSSADSVSEDSQLWVNQSCGLLRPVFRLVVFICLFACVYVFNRILHVFFFFLFQIHVQFFCKWCNFFNRVLEIDEKAWAGLEETAGHSEAKQHVGAVCSFPIRFLYSFFEVWLQIKNQDWIC